MVPFKKMWEDALVLISNNQLKDLNIIKTYKDGFVIKENEDVEFINKEDFVNLWCKMLCKSEIAKDEAVKEGKSAYVYEIIKNLPYIDESCNVLKIVD